MRKHKYSLLLIFIVVAIAFISAYSFIHFYLLLSNHTVVSNNQTLSASSNQKIGPQQIMIPAIGVDTVIQHVGLTKHGAMEVPSNTTDVGWYRLGSQPGEIGSAVIAGHYDGENGTTGVFEKLHLLKKGDKIYITDSNRKQMTFIVSKSRRYNPEADSSEVFDKSGGSYLNLITCDGSWDDVVKSYSKRLVVFTEAIL